MHEIKIKGGGETLAYTRENPDHIQRNIVCNWKSQKQIIIKPDFRLLNPDHSKSPGRNTMSLLLGTNEIVIRKPAIARREKNRHSANLITMIFENYLI